jgi:hypothetical protein
MPKFSDWKPYPTYVQAKLDSQPFVIEDQEVSPMMAPESQIFHMEASYVSTPADNPQTAALTLSPELTGLEAIETGEEEILDSIANNAVADIQASEDYDILQSLHRAVNQFFPDSIQWGEGRIPLESCDRLDEVG